MSGWNWGSVADWCAAGATLLAAAVALLLAGRGEKIRKREVREHARALASYVDAAATLLQMDLAALRKSIWSDKKPTEMSCRILASQAVRLPVSPLNAATQNGFPLERLVVGNIVGLLNAVHRLQGASSEMVETFEEYRQLLVPYEDGAQYAEAIKEVLQNRDRVIASHLEVQKHCAALAQSWVNDLLRSIRHEYGFAKRSDDGEFQLTPVEMGRYFPGGVE